MNDIWNINSLTLFLIFFIPGFISLKVYDLIIPGKPKNFGNSLGDAIAYSSINFVLLSWLIVLIHSNNFFDEYKFYYYLCLIIIFFIVPVFLPLIFLILIEWEPVRKIILSFKRIASSRILKPWDCVFSKIEACWVIVHLRDGEKVGGIYDKNDKKGTESLSSSYPADEQIFLGEVWKLDSEGRFIEPVERGNGMIIMGKDIVGVEFFKNEEE
ncbi:MAG: hypothetical protein JRJ49_04690 [Deltaproteobacteria bacterium]|nr:hypothetical protein [Deltaproteobacteria bacterium]